MKTVVVTGPTSGIGTEIAKHFVQRGDRVILACRNVEKGQKLQRRLLELLPLVNDPISSDRSHDSPAQSQAPPAPPTGPEIPTQTCPSPESLRRRVASSEEAPKGTEAEVDAPVHEPVATQSPLKSSLCLESPDARVWAKAGRRGEVHVMRIDLADLNSVRQFVEAYKEAGFPLHILINNAGIMDIRSPRCTTPQGFEAHFGTNYLGPYLLTRLLASIMLLSAPARVVNVSSVAHLCGHIDFEDFHAHNKYSGARCYSRSKLAQVISTYDLNERLQPHGITVSCTSPGAVYTNIFKTWLPWLLRWVWVLLMPIIWLILSTPKQGARSTIRLATDPSLEGQGGRFTNRHGKNVRSSRASYDPLLRRVLWEKSSLCVGLPSD